MAKTVLEFEKPLHVLEVKIIEMEIMSTDSNMDMKKEIKKLRKKIAAELPDEELIHSLYAVGYKFE